MTQRFLSSKNPVASSLAAGTGMAPYLHVPFPESNIFLQMLALKSPSAFGIVKYPYILFLFSTPYIGVSMLFSGIYIFTLRATRRIRAFEHDWRRNEPKLHTSIGEGISVFLSLFDGNPAVKRTFCPPAECYYPLSVLTLIRFGQPLPSSRRPIENGKVCDLNFRVAMNASLAKALGVVMKPTVRWKPTSIAIFGRLCSCAMSISISPQWKRESQ